jgi:hypothetical protein
MEFSLKAARYQLVRAEYDGWGGVDVTGFRTVESKSISSLAKEITDYADNCRPVKYGYYITLTEVDERGYPVPDGFDLRVLEQADRHLGATKLKKYIANHLAKQQLLEGLS